VVTTITPDFSGLGNGAPLPSPTASIGTKSDPQRLAQMQSTINGNGSIGTKSDPARVALTSAPPPDFAWQRIAQNWMRAANQGKLASTGVITLANGDNVTRVVDARAGPTSSILFMPMTAHAAVEWRYLVVIRQQAGEFSIEHRVLTYTDHTYRYAILG